MPNPLKAAYAAKSAPTAPAPAAAPVTASSAPVAVAPSTPASVSDTPSTPGAGRSLAEMRARLAGRNGGVNPPEAKIADNALDPKTRETPDGGAQPIPPAGSDSPETSDAGTSAPTTPTGTPELTRGQKAAATRAANKASKAGSAPASSTPVEPPSAGSGAEVTPAAEASAKPFQTASEVLGRFTTEQLLAEVFSRVTGS